ncbi:synaptic vesicular amine transporter-like [Amphibalanus amphitrite]|uniref:synaptic vesicular amine transporter-like n=1 Tax=Amphibalanus amphitrite TaxID=1232801 RepID=UPI001C921A8F|nr:synaptic vesicular amine transporter-like [Amphibalanus amphitrite]
MVAEQSDEAEASPTRSVVTSLVYVSLLLDNVLLSAVVPMMPAFLSELSGAPPSVADSADAAHTAQTLLFTHLFSNLSSSGDGRTMLRSRTSVLPDYFPPDRDASSEPNVSAAVETLTPARPPTALAAPAGPDPGQPPVTPTAPDGDRELAGELARRQDGRIGVLLSSKAFVQLLANGVVGAAVARVGFRLPLVFGVAVLALSAFLFAVASGVSALFLARAIQGVGSSCIAVSGLSTVADLYPNERERSRVMGRVLGAMAVGVLIGYPFGGLSYDLMGKAPPFWLLTLVLIGLLVIQYRQLRPLPVTELPEEEEGEEEGSSPAWWRLLRDRRVCIVTAAVGISTSVMAILEPTLPAWLMRTIHPQKWQLGSVFIPDSLGYLIGTHGFGVIALRLGRWRTAAAAMMTVGTAAMLLPQSTRMVHLILPHFCIGLGIGIVDASLMPLLARLVERHGLMDGYGAVYALSQTAVCLAYSVGPFVGGYLASSVGFGWLLAILGLLNLLFTPWLVLLRELPAPLHSDQERDCPTRPLTGRGRRAPHIADLDGLSFSYTQMSEG